MSNKSHLAKLMLGIASLAMISGCGVNGTTSNGTVTGTSSAATTSSTAATSETTSSAPTTSSATTTSSAPASSENTLDPSKLKCEISFWNTIGKTNQATFDSFVSAFNKIYPNIKVTSTAQGSYDSLKDTISNQIAGHTCPTMAYCYPDHVAEYLAAGAVLKLDDYIDSTKWGLGVDNGLSDQGKADFIQTYWNEGNQYTVDGVAVPGVYSLPFSKSTEVMFYNKTVFDTNGWSVPTTWDEMWALCQDIRDANPTKNEDGTYKVNPFGYDSDANWYITMSEQSKIPYTSGTVAEGGSHFLFNNDQAKAMVNKMKGYYDKGFFKTQATSANNAYTSTQFTAQTLYMSIGSTGGTTYNYNEGFETGVAAIPQADLDAGKVIMQGPSICFFKDATAEQRLAAWLFYKFITNTKNSAIWSVETGYNPVRTSSFADTVYTNRSDTTGAKGLVKKVADFLADSKINYPAKYYTSPAFKGSSTARVEVGSLLGSVMLGTKTTEKAFADALSNCLFAA